MVLPVSYEKAYETLKGDIDSFQPDYVLALGLAAQRESIQLERIAINVDHSSQPDNLGVTKNHEPILSEGPDGLFSTLPLEQWLEYAQVKNYPVTLSNSAGTYVCNNLMYKLLYCSNKRYRSGFIHVPPHLPVDNMTKTILDLCSLLIKKN